MRIFLIGFMGSGKSTLGRPLAAKLGYKFIDQDALIEERFKMSISEVFATYGEAKFREAEHEVLKSFEASDNLVIATGGGAPCFFDNILIMNNIGFSIYLKIEPKTLVNRLKTSFTSRPLIAGKSEKELLEYVTEKLSEREPFYNKATVSIKALDIKVSDIMQVLNHCLNLQLKTNNL